MRRVLAALVPDPSGGYWLCEYTRGGKIVLNFHPLLRVAVNRSLRNNIDGNPDLTDEQREGLERIYANEEGAFDALVREVAAGRGKMPTAGLQAWSEPHKQGSPGPWVNWLTHGGFAWLYSMAQIIASMFGWHLPPLPPIPPIPAGVP